MRIFYPFYIWVALFLGSLIILFIGMVGSNKPENKQIYKEEDIKNLQLFSEIKPRLYMELDKYDLLIDPIPDKVPGELPF